MSGDYTRFTFDPHKRYSGVWQQQGRAQMDSDWIEAVEIIKRRVRALSLDAIGPSGLPLLTTPNAFLVGVIAGPPLDLSLERGRLYVTGLLAEILPDETFTYLDQPFLPDPPPLPAGDVVVFLDVWEREITYIEDPMIADVALGGADTATRTQTVWQVRVGEVDGARCGAPVGDPPSAGRLTTQAFAPPAPDDPCLLPPLSGYRGLENRLYRVEVHVPGPLGTALFKWSRDNGSIVSAVTAIAVAGGQTTLTVTRIGRDPVLRFRINDWVTVTDDHRELHGERGEMACIIDIDEAQSQIVLDRALPTPGQRAFGATAGDIADRHTRVQRWDQTAATNTIDADGLVLTAAGPIDLEDGVQVLFSTDPVGGSFRVGDYWSFAARTADASLEILTNAPPRGIHHHYLQLAAINGLGGPDPIVDDCRRPPTDGEGRERCCCCLVTVGANEGDHADFTSLAAAIGALANLAPDPATYVVVCVLPGNHLITETVRVTRPRVTIQGCGWSSRLVGRRETLIRLEGEEDVLEKLSFFAEQEAPLVEALGTSQRIRQCRFENQGPGASVRAPRTVDLKIEDNLSIGSGGFELAGGALEVVSNRLLEGPIRIGHPSEAVRIRNNDLLGSRGDGIVLGAQGVIYEIDILANHIGGARGNAIVSGFFDPENAGRDGIIDGLRIVGNDLVDCVRAPEAPQLPDLPRGGIVLGRVYDFIARDNRIESNGNAAVSAICGIFVRHSRGVEISRNVIRENGRQAGGAAFAGPQAGIRLQNAASVVPANEGGVFEMPDVMPAARIADNIVSSPRGQALYIRGQGAMSVDGNKFQAVDIIGPAEDASFSSVDLYTGTVFIFNNGLPAYFASFLSGAGFGGLSPGAPVNLTGTPMLDAIRAGGHVQFLGNQVRLDLTLPEGEIVLANVLIASMDDTVIADNQTEGILLTGQGGHGGPLQMDLMLADLWNFAVTTRQTNNGFMSTPLLTMFSIVSLGLVNHCIGNQTTSCVRAIGVSPISVIRDNAVLFPHPSFCPRQ